MGEWTPNYADIPIYVSKLKYFLPREKLLCSIGGGGKRFGVRLNIVKWTTQWRRRVNAPWYSVSKSICTKLPTNNAFLLYNPGLLPSEYTLDFV